MKFDPEYPGFSFDCEGMENPEVKKKLEALEKFLWKKIGEEWLKQQDIEFERQSELMLFGQTSIPPIEERVKEWHKKLFPYPDVKKIP